MGSTPQQENDWSIVPSEIFALSRRFRIYLVHIFKYGQLAERVSRTLPPASLLSANDGLSPHRSSDLPENVEYEDK